ncbi:MAG: DUF863 family protein [Halobacteriovoraceae bacterium]|nr:DUF863 family protein [Halobacteriovoraceae bacterium]
MEKPQVKLWLRGSIFRLFISLFILFQYSIQAEISPELLKEKFVSIERVSTKANGFYYGLREASSKRYIKAKDCRFTYEKGQDGHPKTDKEFAYERFMISFSGQDEKGEMSFDSVSYGHSDYIESFKPLDFSKGFQPVKLKQVELEGVKLRSSLKAIRNMKGELKMEFHHKEVYSAKNSSFFMPGETRVYTVEVLFDQFDKQAIKLKKIIVNASQLTKTASKRIISVHCLDFKEED